MNRSYPYIGKYNALEVRFTAPSKGVVTHGTWYWKEGEVFPRPNCDIIIPEKDFEVIKKEPNEMQNLKNGDIIIGSQLKAGGAVSFSSSPKVQPNIIVANQEAERLAKMNTEKKFVVVKVMGVASVPTPGVKWE